MNKLWLKRAMQLRKSWPSHPLPYAKLAKILKEEGFFDITEIAVRKAIGSN